MWGWVAELSPAMQALLGTMFTWGMTALGAAVVFMTKSIHERLMDSMLGFAGGVMIAASFWSLLAPAIEMAEQDAMPAWLPATVGFLAGGLFLAVVVEEVIPGSQENGHKDMASMALMLGFTIMMMLDVALG